MSDRSDELFDSWLEAGLVGALGSIGEAPAPAEARYREEGRRTARRGVGPLLSGVSAAAGANFALLTVVTAVAATTGGAVAETAVTGSPSPVVWTEQVVGAVASCGSDLADGSVGSCAREFVKPPAEQRIVVAIPGTIPRTMPPTASLQPSASPVPATSPTRSPSAGPSVSPSPSPSPTHSPSPSPSPSPGQSPSPSPSPSHSPSPTPTHTPSPTHGRRH